MPSASSYEARIGTYVSPAIVTLLTCPSSTPFATPRGVVSILMGGVILPTYVPSSNSFNDGPYVTVIFDGSLDGLDADDGVAGAWTVVVLLGVDGVEGVNDERDVKYCSAVVPYVCLMYERVISLARLNSFDMDEDEDEGEDLDEVVIPR